jgi:hypothetical protein
MSQNSARLALGVAFLACAAGVLLAGAIMGGLSLLGVSAFGG